MPKNVAVINEIADRRPTKIHPNLDARVVIALDAGPVRNLDHIEILAVFHRHSVLLKQQEMNLMDVKLMVLQSTVFDRPILHGSVLGRNRRGVVRIEKGGSLSVDRNVKVGWTEWIVGIRENL